jgi:hypothetical protein
MPTSEEYERLLADKDVIIGTQAADNLELKSDNLELKTQLSEKDAQLVAKEAVISKLKSDLVVSAAALDQSQAAKKVRDAEVERLVKDLHKSGCVNQFLGKILSDFERYEKSIIPTSCAHNCLRF